VSSERLWGLNGSHDPPCDAMRRSGETGSGSAQTWPRRCCLLCRTGAASGDMISAWSDARRRLLLALVAEEPTVGLDIPSHVCSCVTSRCGRCTDRLATLEDVDDDRSASRVGHGTRDSNLVESVTLTMRALSAPGETRMHSFRRSMLTFLVAVWLVELFLPLYLWPPVCAAVNA
jgi:hypothetical protein